MGCSRGDFLRQLAWGVPAACLLPSLLFSCTPEEESLFGDVSFSGKVAVIGAGVAGLHAAAVLQKRGIEVVVYEASGRIGGRIKSQSLNLSIDVPVHELLTGHSLELGADFIYGHSNQFYDLVRSYSPLLQAAPKSYLIEEQRTTLQTFREDAAYATYLDIKAKLDAYQGEDMPLATYLSGLKQAEQTDLDDAGQEAVDIRYARAVRNWFEPNTVTEYGVDLQMLSLHAYIAREKNKTYGDSRYRLQEGNFYSALTTLYQSIKDIHYNSVVENINHEGEQVVISIKDKPPATVDKVIITVPVATLPNIVFSPELPADKLTAIGQIKMGSCVKVFLRFSQDFWSDTPGALYLSSRSLFSLVLPHPTEKILTLSAYGSGAEQLSRLGTSEIRKVALSVLDDIFGGQVASAALQDLRASKWTAQNKIVDGVEELFIPGAYSYTLPGATNARAALAAPIANTVYFAGEATHTHGHAATVHGAIETGYRAAYELLKNI